MKNCIRKSVLCSVHSLHRSLPISFLLCARKKEKKKEFPKNGAQVKSECSTLAVIKTITQCRCQRCEHATFGNAANGCCTNIHSYIYSASSECTPLSSSAWHVIIFLCSFSHLLFLLLFHAQDLFGSVQFSFRFACCKLMMVGRLSSFVIMCYKMQMTAILTVCEQCKHFVFVIWEIEILLPDDRNIRKISLFFFSSRLFATSSSAASCAFSLFACRRFKLHRIKYTFTYSAPFQINTIIYQSWIMFAPNENELRCAETTTNRLWSVNKQVI